MTFLAKALGSVGLQLKQSGQPKVFVSPANPGGTMPQGLNAPVSNHMALSAVWACTQLISGTLSSLPIEVRRKSKSGVAEVADQHPLHNVLNRSPNFDQTPLDFVDFLCQAIELRGNGYARISRSEAGNIKALYPINPTLMSVSRSTSGRIRYRWTEGGKSFEAVDRDVLHVRGPGGHPLGGMSTLQYAASTLSTASQIEISAGSFHDNRMSPGVVLEFPEFLSEEDRMVVREQLKEQYVGARNAGVPFVAEGGVNVKTVSISPEDSQLLETRQFSVEEICRFFSVPPALIGHAGASTAWPTSVDQQMQHFQKFTLRRRVVWLEQALEQQLLGAVARDQGYSVKLNMEALLRGDSAGRSSFYQTMAAIGAMTINEIRELEGLPAVEGGDQPRIQAQNIPLSETGAHGDGNA